MSESKSQSGGSVQSFMIGALIGAAAGASIALLYAPKKGRELRNDITSTVGDISSRLSALLASAKEAGEDLVSEAVESGNEIVSDAYRRAESLIEEAERIITDARARVID
ncbi:MAG: YtxH domain-containing protein [Ignavibacteriota bacterium]